jgi:hypothetical protein
LPGTEASAAIRTLRNLFFRLLLFFFFFDGFGFGHAAAGTGVGVSFDLAFVHAAGAVVDEARGHRHLTNEVEEDDAHQHRGVDGGERVPAGAGCWK